MSSSEDEPGLQLRYAERPVMRGTRLVIWRPAACTAFAPEPFKAGQGFTIDVTGDDGEGRWRATLQSWLEGPEGVLLTLEVEGRYPASTPAARSS